MIKLLGIRVLWMLLGYFLAVLVATTVVCIGFGLPTVFPDNGRFGSFYGYLIDFPTMFIVGGMMTAFYGLPGWLISVTMAEWRGQQGKYWFSIAGALSAALAILIAGSFQRVVDGSWLNIAILIGGVAGGLAYWALAGETSGNWKLSEQAGP